MNKNKDLLLAVLRAIKDPIRMMDQNRRVVWANDTAKQFFGPEILGQSCCELYRKLDDSELPVNCPTVATLADGTPYEETVEIPLLCGEKRIFRIASSVAQRDEHGQPITILEVFWDVTKFRQTKDALRKSEQLFRTVIESSNDAMIAIDQQGRITLFNPGAEAIFGHAKDTMLGQRVDRLVPEEYRNNHQAHVSSYFAGDKISQVVGQTVELPGLRANGQTFPMELSLSAGQSDNRRFVLAIIRDITERKRFEQQLVYQARHDELTGLPNRSQVRLALQQAIAKDEGADCQLAVLLLDLDHFKTVNDTFGHSGGNTLLRLVAARLREGVRHGDLVGRLYSDEFVLLLKDVGDRNAVRRALHSIEQAFARPFVLAGSQLFISFSLGVAFFPNDADNADELLKKADLALNATRNQGKSGFSVFTPQMAIEQQQRVEMESLLQQAANQDGFLLHYQPRVDLVSGRIVGLEALLRWQPENRAAVSPAEFVPVLEEIGLIEQVGEWVLEQACLLIRRWQEQGLPAARVWVNISSQQFLAGTLPERVANILRRTGLSADYLGLEITESMLMSDVTATVHQLQKLKSLGLRISVDDFGTGYSSLSYLQRFPIDEIKIDRSFVDGLGENENDTTLVRTIISMGRSLGLRVVAEGVERPAQHAILQQLHCHEMQGFLFCKPQPEQAIAALLAAEHQALGHSAAAPQGRTSMSAAPLR